jgi:hypothetical protein
VLDENTYGYVPEFEQFLTNGIDDNLTDKLWFVDGIGDYIFEYGNFESSRLQKNPGIAEGYPDFFGYDITRTEAPPIVFSTGYEDGITYYDIYMPLTIYGVEIPEPASLALFAFAALLFRKTTY